MCICAGWYMWITCYHFYTLTFLYSRHHPWVSRLPAGLKGGETSFIALTADLETVLQFCSSSLCLHSNVALMVCLTITSTGIVICTMSGPQEGTDCIFIQKFVPPATTAGGQKRTFACEHLCCGGSWVCVTLHLNADNDLWTNMCPGLEGPAAWDDTRVLQVGSCCVQVRSDKAVPVDFKLFGAVGSDKLWWVYLFGSVHLGWCARCRLKNQT